MLRWLSAVMLFLAAPVFAQGHAPERAAQCVHAATTSLLAVGAPPEQLAPMALARCFDEIEAVLGSVNAEALRIALRRELYDYALDVASRASPDPDPASTLPAFY